MKLYSCELDGCSLVLLGSFNPSIFHPLWLEKFNLISKEEADKAELKIVQPEVTSFRVGAIDVLVRPDRFQLQTTDPASTSQVRDMGLGCFRVLDQTPIRRMGINRMMHFKMATIESWHAVGHRLAPKEIWKELRLESLGTLGVNIEGHRPNSPAKTFNILVAPSKALSPGVYVGTNEHFETEKVDAQILMDWLANQWEPCNEFARELAENLLSKCLSQNG